MSKSSLACLAGLLLVVIAGCFPVELDVNSKGEILVPRQEGFFVYDPATRKASMLDGARGGRPVFARFAPNGKHALLITKLAGDSFRFDLTALSEGKPKTIYAGQSTAYTLFSPDGKFLAVSRVTEKKRKDSPDSRIAEILLIDLADNKTTTLLEETLVSFRWFSDSKRLALFKIESADKENNLTGHLIEFDIATKQEKRLAAAMSGQKMCIELAPNQQSIVFSATRAGKPNATLDRPTERITRGATLWQWHAKDDRITAFYDDAEYASFSPSGDRILLARLDPSGSGELRIADADGKTVKKLVDNVTLAEASDLTLPGWLDENTVHYFATRHTYGAGGKSLALHAIHVDGKAAKNLQPALDHAIHQLVKDMPDIEPDRGLGVLDGPDLVPGKVVIGPEKTKRRWTDTLLSRDGLLVFGTTVLIAVVLAVFVIRRVRRPPKKPETPDQIQAQG